MRTVKLTRRGAMAGLIGSALAPRAFAATPDFHDWAWRPPMGWNSWDSFGPTITEAEARDNAKVMAAKLLPSGYQYFTVDIQWYEPGANSYDYRKGAPLTMDAWGRLMPAPNRFPSAADGAGFKPLADFVHGLGLKFGIHVMRGVPRQAADRNLPILGAKTCAGDIADRVNVCPWNTDMYGIDMSKPGAQAYYDSIFKLYASWGVDFVKVDDLSRPYVRNQPEVEAVRRAIDKTCRPMVLSLSPGETALEAHDHVAAHANMWRISDDFWDSWPALVEQFARLRNWNPYRRVGAWPDADMLPLGVLDMGKRKTNFTPDEQRTLMTLWSIARSPLIMGGDLRKLDAATETLLTNISVVGVNQLSRDNRELFFKDDLCAWTARDVLGHPVVAAFNLRNTQAAVPVDVAALGVRGRFTLRDLWQGTKSMAESFAPTIPPHGAGLYQLSEI